MVGLCAALGSMAKRMNYSSLGQSYSTILSRVTQSIGLEGSKLRMTVKKYMLKITSEVGTPTITLSAVFRENGI